jgi:hypothetical protein
LSGLKYLLSSTQYRRVLFLGFLLAGLCERQTLGLFAAPRALFCVVSALAVSHNISILAHSSSHGNSQAAPQPRTCYSENWPANILRY